MIGSMRPLDNCVCIQVHGMQFSIWNALIWYGHMDPLRIEIHYTIGIPFQRTTDIGTVSMVTTRKHKMFRNQRLNAARLRRTATHGLFNTFNYRCEKSSFDAKCTTQFMIRWRQRYLDHIYWLVFVPPFRIIEIGLIQRFRWLFTSFEWENTLKLIKYRRMLFLKRAFLNRTDFDLLDW